LIVSLRRTLKRLFIILACVSVSSYAQSEGNAHDLGEAIVKRHVEWETNLSSAGASIEAREVAHQGSVGLRTMRFLPLQLRRVSTSPNFGFSTTLILRPAPVPTLVVSHRSRNQLANVLGERRSSHICSSSARIV
jgi:hypothetical protein